MADRFTLRLDSLAYGGEAVGRHDGKAVFVPYGAPGDEAEVEVTSDHGRFARARLLGVTRPSLARRSPACPHFGPGACGGCHWQHLEYSAQLDAKRRVVTDQLARIGGLSGVAVSPAIGMDDPWRYRNHIQLVAEPDGTLGYQAAASHRTVVVSECPIAHPLLAGMVTADDGRGPWRLPAGLSMMRGARVALRAVIGSGERLMLVEGGATRLRTSGTPPYSVVAGGDRSTRVLAGRGWMDESLGGRTFRVSARSFFQVNTQQAGQLARLVREAAALTGSESVLDLFCGVGVFGLLLAPTAGAVTGIEENPDAVADARVNAGEAANVRLLQGPAESMLAGVTGPVDVVVVDPPRQGCAPAVMAGLIRLAPARIVYVSCDPSTLARDAAALVRAGYALTAVTPVDMFPQTYHTECVARLERRQGS